ncbi:hypothetical protein ACIQSP_19960 [Streptomyces nigra]|uniref:hypothetical protein n=1 Tax=Streptomyces nigra TaxID=1827580 RepID=UPI003801F304
MTDTCIPRAWDDDDNRPVIPKIPHPRPGQHPGCGPLLDTALQVARQILADFGDSRRDGFSYPAGYGATFEALRLLVRAVDAETGDVPSGPSSSSGAGARCPAAHPDDPDPCVGPVAVMVLDADNAGAKGCEHHGARLLASLEGGRVYALPDAPDGAAIRVFRAAADLPPFAWVERGERR